MDYPKRKMSETEILFHSNRKQFRKIFNSNVENTLQNYIEQRDFFYDVWLPFVNDAETPLIELSFIQYPLLGKTTNPARPVEFAKQTFNRVFLEYIQISNDNHCSRLIVTFNRVR